MKLEELKSTWQREISVIENNHQLTQDIEKMAKKTSAIDKKVRSRDIVESSVSLLLIPFWLYSLMSDANNVYTYTGLIILILVCAFIPFKLMQAKQVDNNKINSLHSFLQIEIQKNRKQSHLLKSLFWWYLAPIFAGILLVTLGSCVNEAGNLIIDKELIIYYGICLVIGISVYFYNQWYANQKLNPIITQLEKSLADLLQE